VVSTERWTRYSVVNLVSDKFTQVNFSDFYVVALFLTQTESSYIRRPDFMQLATLNDNSISPPQKDSSCPRWFTFKTNVIIKTWKYHVEVLYSHTRDFQTPGTKFKETFNTKTSVFKCRAQCPWRGVFVLYYKSNAMLFVLSFNHQPMRTVGVAPRVLTLGHFTPLKIIPSGSVVVICNATHVWRGADL
jgi:hypothetical protein